MLIAIEGITGIGKSTLQNTLSQYYKAELLVQEFEKHPYLSTSDDEVIKFALEREIIFLFMAYHQLNNIDTNDKVVISDFIFEKLKVFAITSLSKDDLENVYYPCFSYLRKKLRKPDLTIYLTGSSQFALSNIQHRDRAAEAYITENHLSRLSLSFEVLFQEYKGCKVIKVDAEHNNLLYDKSAIYKLVQLIETELPNINAYRIN